MEKIENICLETIVQQEMRKLCKKFNIPFTKIYYDQNHDLYVTYVLGKLQQKVMAEKIINTLKN